MSASELRIPFSNRLLHGMGFFDQLGGKCQLVLTEDHFAWSATLLPPLIPQAFDAIPLSLIRSVKFTQTYEPFGSSIAVEIATDSPNEQMKSIRGTVGSPYRWVKAFKEVGVPVIGEEFASLKSARGFLNNYGWMIGFLLVIILSIIEGTLCNFIIRPANFGLIFFFIFPFVPVNSFLLLGVVTWWRYRRREKANN